MINQALDTQDEGVLHHSERVHAHLYTYIGIQSKLLCHSIWFRHYTLPLSFNDI